MLPYCEVQEMSYDLYLAAHDSYHDYQVVQQGKMDPKSDCIPSKLG